MLSHEFMKQVAARKKRQRLAGITVLVADQDQRIALLVRDVLESFGFQHVLLAYDPMDAASLVMQGKPDLVISEWPMTLPSGEDFVQFIRRSDKSPRRDIPIVMLTAHSEQHHVEAARDAGVTEFVAKPFTAKTLSNRLIQVIDNPRAFIMTKSFTGPDRRRRGEPPEGVADRRMPRGELQKHGRIHGDGMIYTVGEQQVVVKNPDRKLKEAIGSDLTAEKIFDPDNIRQAQQVILNMKTEYNAWVADDIGKMDAIYMALSMDMEAKEPWDILRDTTFSMIGQAGTFGYHLASEVAKSLYEYVIHTPAPDAASLVVLRKHIDTLYVIFSKEMVGDGENIGREVVEALHELVGKYMHS